MNETPDYVFVPDPEWTEGLKSGRDSGKDENFTVPVSQIQINRWGAFDRPYNLTMLHRPREYPVTGAFLSVDGVECRQYVPREHLKRVLVLVAATLKPEQEIRLRFPR